ncbi:hypothetical protein EUX98_g6771 [Antrodiella citrinella]|uniref:Peptidase A1 domain-containing protein n=1 Tax=Antrodiella citrinella TaxID=2447956 RepID=A0A4S4MNB4_9APHY|nr:hypothetical protein EUX98_g6771 [Antrodiella citrinella]
MVLNRPTNASLPNDYHQPKPSLWIIELHNGDENRLTQSFITGCILPALDAVERDWRKDIQPGPAKENAKKEGGKGALIIVGNRSQNKFFSNGLDFNNIMSQPDNGANFFPGNFPLPVIAALNGHVFAGGLILALCCDYRVMVDGKTRNAWLCMNEIHFGAALPPSFTYLVRAKCPGVLPRKIFLEGHRFTPSEALDAGLVDHLVSGGTDVVLAKSQELADSLEHLAQLGSYGLAKRELYRDVIEGSTRDIFLSNTVVEHEAARIPGRSYEMQLALSFVLLLASVLVSLSPAVDAAPSKRAPGLVTLPLKRIHQSVPNGSVHPQVFLQQNINRSLKRFARMTGRDVPSDAELKRNIHKRLLAIDEAEFAKRAYGKRSHSKRFNRHGIPTLRPTADTGGKSNGLKANKNGQGQAPAAAGAALNTSTADESGPGFSEVDLNAQNSGGLTAANTPTTGNSLGLDIEANDVGYIATVQIGTPPRDFKLLMDSGSADFWVGAEGCQSQGGGGCGNHVFLGEQSSSSFVDSGNPFSVTYGSGSVSGDIITDDVSIAGLALPTHTFGVATTESVDFSADTVPFDGLMGLAQSSLSEQKTLTPVESLAQAGLIQDAITSFKISRLSDDKNDGEVTFGGLDSSKFDASTLVTFNNVNQEGFWEGAVSFSVDGTDLGLSGRTAILDTGTTLIVAPPADAATVHAAIPGAKSDGQGGFTIPCTTSVSFALTFGAQTFDVNPQDLLFTPVDPTDLTGDCVSGISSGTVGSAQEWLLGDVFLKNAYFSTDVTQNQISLAKLV